MSITATGGPLSSRPCAPAARRRCCLAAVEPADETSRRRFLERFTTAGQARIGHEIVVGVEGLLARGCRYATRRTIRQYLPALFSVLEIGNHDLAKNLRSEEHTSELQSRENLVCRLL